MRKWKNSQAIATAIDKQANRIAKHYYGKQVVMVVVLKGAFIFSADLIRALSKYMCYPTIEFIYASSYGKEQKSSGTVDYHCPPSTFFNLKNKYILLVDDICDTGLTLKTLRVQLEQADNIVSTCVLIKQISKKSLFIPDFVCVEKMTKEFVIGYGLDDMEGKRGLPDIYTI